MLKRILSLFLLLILVLMPAATFLTAPPEKGEITSLQAMEEYLKDNLIFGQMLKNISSEVLLQSGQRERQNVFYSEDGLLANYWPEQGQKIRNSNTHAIIAFAESHDVPVCSVVIPTAAAVKQKNIPDNAPLFNQKEAIAEISREMEGRVTAADVYSTLYQGYDENDEYLYYRTTDRLTTLGGYRVYDAVGERLRLSPLPLRSFSKEYVVHDYYGDLTESWGQNRVDGDILAVYHNNDTESKYRLKVERPDGTTDSYNTMYPQEHLEQDPFSIFLGGESAGFELTVRGSKEERDLLVFGDNSVQSVVPFFSKHYDRITYCNLETTSRSELRKMDLSEYDQVMFVYSIETYCDSQSIRKIDEIP